MDLHESFTFTPSISLKCRDKTCNTSCVDGEVLVDGVKSHMMAQGIICRTKRSRFSWKPAVKKGKVNYSCSTDVVETTKAPTVIIESGLAAGKCNAVTSVLEIDQSQVNIKCSKKGCSFSCVDDSLSPSRNSIQCKKSQYKISSKEDKSVVCMRSDHPPCGSIDESFDYDPAKITVSYQTFKNQGKTHGQAMFRCIKSTEKVNLLKRKPGKVVVAARLFQKRTRVQLAQYDESGFSVLCKKKKWTHGKKKGKIVFDCSE